jgi:hypothetical protein
MQMIMEDLKYVHSTLSFVQMHIHDLPQLHAVPQGFVDLQCLLGPNTLS